MTGPDTYHATFRQTNRILLLVITIYIITMTTNVSAKKRKKDNDMHSSHRANRNYQPNIPSRHIPKSKLTAPNNSQVPDEHRLYETLMTGYEASVRPVMNASKTITVRFVLRLNQIIGLDERHQVLTTSVFIDQQWDDENLIWDPDEFNGIRTMRIPAQEVWLPDTFVFNNADDGSTGFMRGVHVLLDSNGTVTWPVPVKLRSSCKVDITYFPFDDQVCILRFGSWIYSVRWMNFISKLPSADLGQYVDNSEWELVSLNLRRRVTTVAGEEPRVDLTYRLHIRRRTFYYLFTIIAPCTMLSVLTLLTFWLPTTSGEKVTLGLSVFLAFSMFMVLIAEEVPATSESVPLIGIYLTAVMTMTSVSVIMAVIVINIYNKGYKYRAAPRWLCWLCFRLLSSLLCVKHDIPTLAQTVKLPYERDDKDGRLDSLLSQAYSKHRQQVYPYVGAQTGYMRPVSQDRDRTVFEYGVRGMFDAHPSAQCSTPKPRPKSERNHEKSRSSEKLKSRFPSEKVRLRPGAISRQESRNKGMKLSGSLRRNGSITKRSSTKKSRFHFESFDEDQNEQETSLINHEPKSPKPDFDLTNPAMTSLGECSQSETAQPSTSFQSSDNNVEMSEEIRQKTIIAEWQRIASVIDRLLFWLFFLATLMSYIVILVILPRTKPNLEDITGNLTQPEIDALLKIDAQSEIDSS